MAKDAISKTWAIGILMAVLLSGVGSWMTFVQSRIIANWQEHVTMESQIASLKAQIDALVQACKSPP